MKKITSLFLALVMALALAVPAMAEDVKVETTMNLPTINVVLPTNASMVMNPYQLQVKLNPKDDSETPSTDQILSPLMTVKNLSNIGIQVGITVKGTLGKGAAEFVDSTTVGGSSTDKQVYVYAMFKKGNNTMSVDDLKKPTGSNVPSFINGVAADAVVLSDDEDGVSPTTFDPTAAAATANTLAATSDTKAAADNGVLGFRFFGDMVSSPEDNDGNVIQWTDKDTVAAVVTFTFTPVPGVLPA